MRSVAPADEWRDRVEALLDRLAPWYRLIRIAAAALLCVAIVRWWMGGKPDMMLVDGFGGGATAAEVRRVAESLSALAAPGEAACPLLLSRRPAAPAQRATNAADDGAGRHTRAYVTMVSSGEFVLPAAVLMHSIARTGTPYALAVCVTSAVSDVDRQRLAAVAEVIVVDAVPSPHFIRHARYVDVFTKLRLWQLVMFDKIVYMDTDVVVLRNMDDLFDTPAWGVPLDADSRRLSTGMMVIEPGVRIYAAMRRHLITTNVSMELPDLMFLQQFFETRDAICGGGDGASRRALGASVGCCGGDAAAPAINLFPRWYQVYQEEFSPTASSYMTQRRWPLTIFDERVRGIHYPGPKKPWQHLAKRTAAYAPFACLFGEPSVAWTARATSLSAGLAASGVSSPSVAHRMKELWHDPNFAWYASLHSLRQALTAQLDDQDVDDGAGSAVTTDDDGRSVTAGDGVAWFESLATRIHNIRVVAGKAVSPLRLSADGEVSSCSHRGFLDQSPAACAATTQAAGRCVCYEGYEGPKCDRLSRPELAVTVTATPALEGIRHADYEGTRIGINIMAAAALEHHDAVVKSVELLFGDGSFVLVPLSGPGAKEETAARGGEAGIRVEIHAATAAIARRIKRIITPKVFAAELHHHVEKE